MFRASLRPSSGGETAFSLPMVFCPVVNFCDVGESAARLRALCGVVYSTQRTQPASRLSNITTVTTGQKTIGSENAVSATEDGRKDARNMLRNNWLPIKSLIIASSVSHLYLLIKDARSFEHKVILSFHLPQYPINTNTVTDWKNVKNNIVNILNSSMIFHAAIRKRTFTSLMYCQTNNP
jgi:hypothetical protein